MRYIELYINENGKSRRVYQGVVLGKEDYERQKQTILRNATEAGDTIVEVDPHLWEIYSENGSMWGRWQLRAI